MMDSARFAEVRKVFETLVALDAVQRAARLAALDDPDLRSTLEQMLRAEGGGLDRILEDGARSLADAPGAPAPQDDPVEGLPAGLLVGGFRILRRLGGGGMGAVYEAEQDTPRRRVALKTLRLDLQSSDLLRRFRAEAELLGRLQHPGIARILASGVHPLADGSSLPWIALEYVPHATPITRFADAMELDVEARVALLADVADAVHHGHVKGVLHRDLKPGNVLVGDDGRPRVIDFGIGRALGGDLAVSMPHTRTGEIFGTPSYMSPEQFGGNPAAVDARTDVYSLGVLAYEMLCGRLPHDTAARPITEVARAVRDLPPEKPSHVDRRLRGDLEWILLRALEKEPERRYASAAALADDLRRHLRREPVAAGPPTAIYRLSRLIRRHRAASAAALLALLALLAGGAAAAIGLVKARHSEARALSEAARAQKEADRAGALNRYLLDTLGAARFLDSGPATPIGDVLRFAGREFDPARFSDPRTRAAVQKALGASQSAVGLWPEARANLESALHQLEESFGPADEETLDAAVLLAAVYVQSSALDEARALVERTLPEAREHLGPDHRVTFDLRRMMASIASRAGDVAGAIAILEELVRAETARDPRGERRLLAQASLGTERIKARRLDDAGTALREAVDLAHQLYGPDSVRSTSFEKDLAALQLARGEAKEAEGVLRACLERERAAFGEDHRTTLNTEWLIMKALHRQDREDEAIALGEELIRRESNVLGGLTIEAAKAHGELGGILLTVRRLNEAEVPLRRAIETFEQVVGPNHPETITAKHNLAWALLYQGKTEETLPLARAVHEGFGALLPPDHPRRLFASALLGETLRRGGDAQGALDVLDPVRAAFERVFGAQATQTFDLEMSAARALESAGDPAGAATRLEALRTRAAEVLEPDDYHTPLIEVLLEHARFVAGQEASAANAERALRALEEQLPADALELADARALLSDLAGAGGP